MTEIAETPKKTSTVPTHEEWDWFDRHVCQGYSQKQIADEFRIDAEVVTDGIKKAGRWLSKNYRRRRGELHSKNIYRLERLILGLMKQYDLNNDVLVAREIRLSIHELMEITGGIEKSAPAPTGQNFNIQINNSIDRLLERDEPTNPKLLKAAKTVRSIEDEFRGRESA